MSDARRAAASARLEMASTVQAPALELELDDHDGLPQRLEPWVSIGDQVRPSPEAAPADLRQLFAWSSVDSADSQIKKEMSMSGQQKHQWRQRPEENPVSREGSAVTTTRRAPARPARCSEVRDVESRPRERLMRHGARTLSEDELLAVLLRTGTRGVSAQQLAAQLLTRHGGLAGLRHASLESLLRPGVGPAKAASILAARELAVRIARSELPERSALHRPERAARYLTMRYAALDQEVMGALYLDTRSRLIAEREVYRGTLSRASVEPRGLLRPALLLGASSMLLFHTHPSGDPSPSAEDFAFTRRMVEAANVVGVHLLDHLVLGEPNRWVSLRNEGAW